MLDLTPVGPGRTVDDALYDAHRRALRERLICAALTGLMRQTTAPEPWYAERAISQADAVLAALDEVDALQLLAATPEKLEP